MKPPTQSVRRCASLALFGLATLAAGQSRLPHMPGYDRYVKMRGEVQGAVVRGALQVRWEPDSKGFTYDWQGKRYRFDVSSRKAAEFDGRPEALRAEIGGPRAQRAQRPPARGRQFTEEVSPDGKWTAVYRDRNVWLRPAAGGGEIQVSTDGDESKRVKCGNATWVYGEELGVRSAMWWSPNSKKLAYYRFDESKVPDYYLSTDVTQIQNKLYVEPYVKAGAPNPDVALFVYDLDTKDTVRVDHEFGPDGKELGHYVYDVRWSPDGGELLFHRTNRKQKIMEFCAANLETGKCRVVVREEWSPSWTENHPSLTWFEDKKRFVWVSERNGFRNFYLGDLDGSPLKPITQHNFDVGSVVRLDEKSGTLWYMARSGENPYRFQLHRVGLDGKGDTRLTDPALHHTVSLSPDGKFFTDVAENSEKPPETRLCDANGKVIEVLAKSDLTKFEQLRLKPVEWFKFTAADGKTECWGLLHKPSDFDPSKRYPLIVSVYAGPDSAGGPETFQTPNPATEFGFLVATLHGRGTNGRGKAFKDAVYGKLGIVEIDDQAAGVRKLLERPYVDASRVGIYGTSYGGYSSVMAILRYPDLFHAAVASSSVTDWRNYDSIYTERYMGLPWESENKKGYEEGSAMRYAQNLKGYLLLFYGTADDNVHPSNTYQLAQALQRAGKSFEMMAGPDQGHAGVNPNRMWEFFIERLILHPGGPTLSRAFQTGNDGIPVRRRFADRSGVLSMSHATP